MFALQLLKEPLTGSCYAESAHATIDHIKTASLASCVRSESKQRNALIAVGMFFPATRNYWPVQSVFDRLKECKNEAPLRISR